MISEELEKAFSERKLDNGSSQLSEKMRVREVRFNRQDFFFFLTKRELIQYEFSFLKHMVWKMLGSICQCVFLQLLLITLKHDTTSVN